MGDMETRLATVALTCFFCPLERARGIDETLRCLIQTPPFLKPHSMEKRSLQRWAIVLIFGLAFLALKWWFAAPSEEQLKARYVEHRAEFEELRALVQADAPNDVGRVGISFDYAQNDQGTSLSVSRVARYRALMKSVGVESIGGRGNKFRMGVFGGGFTDTSWSIGYAFSRRKPEIVVPSVYRWGARQNHTAFAPLSENWYLYNSR